ncbi:MAG TPA: hypothetical protein VIV13_05000 [Solirubrobacterales bacterium]
MALAGVSVATPAHSQALDDLLPRIRTGFAALPAPIPVPSEGRVPVSLRLADSIWTDDGSHPPAATKLRLDLDKNFQLDLSDVPRCQPGLHYDIRTEESPCEKEKFATGMVKVEVAFPEEERILVSGRAIAFKIGPGKIMIRTYLGSPVTGEILFPATVGRSSAGAYGVQATVSISKIAAGYGSLTYLGLRFRKGLFSVACRQGRLQSGATNYFADGSVAGGSTITTC